MSRRSSSKSSAAKNYADTEEAKAFRTDQQKRVGYYNEALEKMKKEVEDPLQRCLQKYDAVTGKLRALEMAYDRNEKNLRSAATEPYRSVAMALLVGVLVSVIVALIIYAIVAGQAKKR